MSILVDRPDRVFQLWAYTVSMGRLLLRSTKGEQFRTRVDVLFQNVQAIHLPTSLAGLVVADADDEQVQRIIQDTGVLPDDDHCFYTIVGSNCAGYVVAGVVATDEDRGEYFEPSKLWPGGPPFTVPLMRSM